MSPSVKETSHAITSLIKSQYKIEEIVKNLRNEMLSEVAKLKARIHDLEKGVKLENILEGSNPIFADTVKVNFSNSKPMEKEVKKRIDKDLSNFKKSIKEIQEGRNSQKFHPNNSNDVSSDMFHNPFLENELPASNTFNGPAEVHQQPPKTVKKDKSKDLILLNQRILKSPNHSSTGAKHEDFTTNGESMKRPVIPDENSIADRGSQPRVLIDKLKRQREQKQ